MQHWIDGDGRERTLIVVSEEAVYAETLPAERVTAMEEALKSGESPVRLFSDKATHVVLREVSRAQLSSADDDIDFSLGSGKQARTESLSISDGATREAVFAELERVTQGRLRRYEDQLGRLRAGYASLLALSVFGIGTALLVKAAAWVRAAEEIEISGRRQGLKSLILGTLDLLGPLGIGIIGGLICALCLATLVMRLRQPPHLQILQARPYRPQGGMMTALKYAALLFIWWLFLPPLVF